ncbi:MAG: hypothetical protein PHS19_06450 [Eubacteriales bacterium]|nr:hypothetical protein [Eubacteriales bacterium]
MNITKDIIKHIKTFYVNPNTGWTKELNLVSWNGEKPSYEVRMWDENHDRCSKGMGLSKKELKKVIPLLQAEIDGENDCTNSSKHCLPTPDDDTEQERFI